MELLPISNFDFWVVKCVVGGLAALVDGWGVKIQTPPPPLDGLKFENSKTRTLEHSKTWKLENAKTRTLENSRTRFQCIVYRMHPLLNLKDCLLLAPGNRVINSLIN